MHSKHLSPERIRLHLATSMITRWWPVTIYLATLVKQLDPKRLNYFYNTEYTADRNEWDRQVYRDRTIFYSFPMDWYFLPRSGITSSLVGGAKWHTSRKPYPGRFTVFNAIAENIELWYYSSEDGGVNGFLARKWQLGRELAPPENWHDWDSGLGLQWTLAEHWQYR